MRGEDFVKGEVTGVQITGGEEGLGEENDYVISFRPTNALEEGKLQVTMPEGLLLPSEVVIEAAGEEFG